MPVQKSGASSLSLNFVQREWEVFSKLVVRGRNQHRRDKCYQMLIRVCKDLKRYQAVPYLNDIRKFARRSGVKSKQAKCVAKKVSQCLEFTERTISFVLKTFQEVEKQIHMGLFIPVNLLMLASLSRIWYMLQYHFHALSEVLSSARLKARRLPLAPPPNPIRTLPASNSHALVSSASFKTEHLPLSPPPNPIHALPSSASLKTQHLLLAPPIPASNSHALLSSTSFKTEHPPLAPPPNPIPALPASNSHALFSSTSFKTEHPPLVPPPNPIPALPASNAGKSRDERGLLLKPRESSRRMKFKLKIESKLKSRAKRKKMNKVRSRCKKKPTTKKSLKELQRQFVEDMNLTHKLEPDLKVHDAQQHSSTAYDIIDKLFDEI